MLSGNKGEWSEIYVLFKLLGDKFLFVGDANLKKVEAFFYPIIKILRAESGENLEYTLDGEVVIISGDSEILRIEIKKFKEQSVLLLEKIKKEKGSFSIPELEGFMHEIKCISLKAKSTKKTDIQIVIYDPRIAQTAELGFSIKSQLGSSSTLFNAGKTTNFVFKIKDFNPTDDDLEFIQSKEEIKDRIEIINKLGGTFVFVGPDKPMLRNNLILIDSALPNILAEIIRLYYSTDLNSIKDLTTTVDQENSLGFDKQFAHRFYEYKVKRFLVDVALGMTPAKLWNGIYDATGGYLVVKKSGEVLCYHIYNRNIFEDYLYNNTKLDTASTSRYDFGRIYTDGQDYFFNLNLQVRFK